MAEVAEIFKLFAGDGDKTGLFVFLMALLVALVLKGVTKDLADIKVKLGIDKAEDKAEAAEEVNELLRVEQKIILALKDLQSATEKQYHGTTSHCSKMKQEVVKLHFDNGNFKNRREKPRAAEDGQARQKKVT